MGVLKCGGKPEKEKEEVTTTNGSRWGSQLEFVFACVSYCVGFGNILRFPYLCMRNGGGAFLIPYFMCLVFCGVPLFFLETCLGQFSHLSPLHVWSISPVFKGLGYATVAVTTLFSNYYNMLTAWVIFYLFKSLTSSLPWAGCNNWWNTDLCHSTPDYGMSYDGNSNDTYSQYSANETSLVNMTFGDNTTALAKGRLPSEEYWRFSVLRISSGITDFGSVRWELFGCLVFAWFLIGACLCKGIKSLGKVVYVTALLPYLLLSVFLVRGLTLPGASIGIRYYIIPDWQKLANIRVWVEACMQVFYSLGPGWGGIIAMSQYNRINNNCLRDGILMPVVCCLTSFLAGFVIFSVLGFMAHSTGVDIKDMASGPGLAFIAYPEAILKLPVSPLWSILFFIMLLSLGLGSQFSSVDVLVSSVLDTFTKLRKHKTLIIIAVCVTHLPIGLLYCTQAGMYYFQLVDWYISLITVTTISICECMVVMWIYGHKKFYEDIKLMLGFSPGIIWKVCWGFISPAMLLVAQTYSFVSFSSPYYGDYTYPPAARAFGWMLAFCSAIPIPVVMIYQLTKYKGSLLNRWRLASKPGTEWINAAREAKRSALELSDDYEKEELKSTRGV